MPSKRRLTTLDNKPPEPKFFLDRNLGAYELKKRLLPYDIDVTAHDEKFGPIERDPWIFYWAGKNDYIMVTADLSFKKLFTHQAAITFGATAVFAFTGTTYNTDIRAAAFLKAWPKLLRILKRQPRPFIATILRDGNINLDAADPRPSRKHIDPRDWESYERVCRAEGIDSEKQPPDVSGPAEL